MPRYTAYRDPAYRDLRDELKPAVDRYHVHTAVVKKFLAEHGIHATGWETWDIAPFHVLNVRNGSPVPQEILHALDAAIAGRESVCDRFTEANVDPRVMMDASDITHRVFVEKLRTLRRVWFPGDPERVGGAAATSATIALTPGLALGQVASNVQDSVAVGSFRALSGASAGAEFYKVSFGLCSSVHHEVYWGLMS